MLQHVTLEVTQAQVRDCVAFWELLGFSEMEPPPRRDFEVAYKPARRKTTPNFQVERRSLPRRS